MDGRRRAIRAAEGTHCSPEASPGAGVSQLGKPECPRSAFLLPREGLVKRTRKWLPSELGGAHLPTGVNKGQPCLNKVCASSRQMFLLVLLLPGEGRREEEGKATNNNKRRVNNTHIWCFDTHFAPAAVSPD